MHHTYQRLKICTTLELTRLPKYLIKIWFRILAAKSFWVLKMSLSNHSKNLLLETTSESQEMDKVFRLSQNKQPTLRFRNNWVNSLNYLSKSKIYQTPTS